MSSALGKAIRMCDMKASYRVEKSHGVGGAAGKYVCIFFVNGLVNFDERGTYGTGNKLYETKEKAEAAGKRYLAKMKKNGFEV